MSRPNGPSLQPGAPSTRPARQLMQPGTAPQPGYQQGSVPGQYQAAPDPYAQQGYQNAGQAAARPQPGYTPQHDPYVTAQQSNTQGYNQPPQSYEPMPAQQHTYSPAQSYAPAQSYNPPPQQNDFSQLQVGTDARSLQRPAQQYETWQSAAPPAQDPRGYDLGGYATAPANNYPQHEAPAQAYQQAGVNFDHGHGNQPDWVAHNGSSAGYSQQQGYQQGFEPALGTQGYQPETQAFGVTDDAGEQYEEEEDYEEAPRGRWMKVAAALVGAVVVGGGLAYAYTTIIGPAGNDGKPPVIKSAAGPSKTKPAEPGGKQFANTDSKIMGGRLNDASGASEAEAAGAKKVQTLSVGADGSITPPAGAPAESAQVDFPGAGATLGALKPDAEAAAATVAAAADKPVVVSPPAAQPAVQQAVKMAAAQPAATPETTQSIAAPPAAPKVITATPAAAKPAAAAAVQAPVVKKTTVAAAAPAVAAAPAAAAVTGAGYVAVLASVPASNTSRMAALQQFADMQQKYAGVLANKSPDVKEANLGEKGTYHRLLAGPPGSREAANQVCAQLKTAGYTDSCWVTAY